MKERAGKWTSHHLYLVTKTLQTASTSLDLDPAAAKRHIWIKCHHRRNRTSKNQFLGVTVNHNSGPLNVDSLKCKASIFKIFL